MRRVCLAAAALMLSAVLAGCSFEGTASPGSESGGETAKTTAAKAEAAGVGDTVSGDKWSISLQSAKLFDEIKENEFLTDKPEEGKQFLVLFFEVENLSAEDEYFNYLNFENYVDGYSQALKVLFTKPDGYSALTGDVAAGKKLKGCLAWEVSKDWKELETSYKDDLWSGEKTATFKVTPADITA